MTLIEAYGPPLATLLLAHVIADFPLQTNQIFRWKMQSNLGILLHVAIHLAVTALTLRHSLSMWRLLLLLGVIHFGIDWLKLRIPVRRQTPGFIIDQLAHLLSLVYLAMMFPNLSSWLPLWFVYPALLYSLLPVTLMLIWVMMGDQVRNQPDVTYGSLRPMVLRWSQRAGWLLIVGALFSGGIGLLTNNGLNIK